MLNIAIFSSTTQPDYISSSIHIKYFRTLQLLTGAKYPGGKRGDKSYVIKPKFVSKVDEMKYQKWFNGQLRHFTYELLEVSPDNPMLLLMNYTIDTYGIDKVDIESYLKGIEDFERW
jgi:hypothetical protein